MWQDIVKQRFGTELQDAGNPFSLRDRMQSSQKGIPPPNPDVVQIKAELRIVILSHFGIYN